MTGPWTPTSSAGSQPAPPEPPAAPNHAPPPAPPAPPAARHAGTPGRDPVGQLVALAATVLLLAGATWWQGRDALRLRAGRDAERAALAADSIPLRAALADAQAIADSIAAVLDARAAGDSASDRPYLVVSIADNRLWYKRGEEVLFETRVATGSGKYLEKGGAGGDRWKFETPRGRLLVERKDVEPAWVPPDWHYIEKAQARKLGVVRLLPGMELPAEGGAVVTVSGANVVKRFPDGTEVPYEVKDGGEIRVGDQLVVPPFGTNQRRYLGVLGVNRLYLGDGYAIHGTDNPRSIGRSVSHGCIRVRNEDIETLFRLVDVGTPVYVY